MKRKFLSLLLCMTLTLGLVSAVEGQPIKAKAASTLEFKTINANVTPPTVKLPTLDTSGNTTYYFGQYGNGFYGVTDNSGEGIWELVDTDSEINNIVLKTAWSSNGTGDGQLILDYANEQVKFFNECDRAAMKTADRVVDQPPLDWADDCDAHSGSYSGSINAAYMWPLSMLQLSNGSYASVNNLAYKIYSSGRKLVYWTRSYAGIDYYKHHGAHYVSSSYYTSVKRSDGGTDVQRGIMLAFNLDLNHVLMSKTATADKAPTELGKYIKPSGNLKFLIVSGNAKSNFNIKALNSKEITNAYAGAVYSFEYTGASTETVNGGSNYISMILYDSAGNIFYYGNLCRVTKSTGIATLTMPAWINTGEEYTLAIFQEEKCDAYKTDYASTPIYTKFVLQDKPNDDISDSSSSNSSSSDSSNSSNITIDDANNILDPNYEGRVSVDFVNEVASFNNTEDYEIAYTSVAVNKKMILSRITGNNWEDATGETEIDLSWVNKGKDSALVFRFTQGDNIIYDMLPCVAQEKNLKVGLSATSSAISIKNVSSTPDFADNVIGSEDNGYLYFYTLDSKSKTATVISPASIEWKRGTADTWVDCNEVSVSEFLDTYKKKGATIYFRIKSDNRSWPSKEVKYSYKKQANAPSVKVDTSKNSINLKTGQEYRIKVGNKDFSDWISILKAYGEKVKSVGILDLYTGFIDGATNAAISKSDIYGEDANGIRLEVRTEANTKKAAIPSKSTYVNIQAANTVAVTFNATGASVKVAFTNDIDTTDGVTITNGYPVAVEYAVCAKGVAASKFTSLKAGKSVSLKSGKFDVSSTLVVRVPGNKKDGILPGEEVVFQFSDLLYSTKDNETGNAVNKE